MLPSKGFFKKNDCPFFENGLCVRPHCHFRHRKKVLNDPSPNTEAEADSVEDDTSLIELIREEVPDSDEKPCSSTSEDNDSKESNSSHDTLFAKLVNQSNTYERINRHIPCAYTPTPQSKRVEPKNKTVGGIVGFGNSEKSLELITKARTLLKNYCAENIKQCESKSTESSEKKTDSCEVGSASSDHPISVVNSYEYDEHIPGTKESDDSLKRNEVATEQQKQSSNSSEVNTSVEYVPEKQGLNDGQIVLKTSNLKYHSAYVPSGLTISIEAKSEKNSNTSVTNPGEKARDISLIEDVDDGCPKLDFLNSEVKVVKKLINDDGRIDNDNVVEKDKHSSEEKENKNKNKEESHSSRHGYSSRHKSSRSHSRSSSKHSSSHSSRHSRSSSSSSRHRSSSSRHHSSSSSRKSSDRHSSSRHSKDHHKKRHSEKYGAESERKKLSGSNHDSSDKIETSLGHSKSSSSSEEDEGDEEEEEDDSSMEVDTSPIFDNNTEDEFYECSSRKRKRTEEEDKKNTKYISLSNYEVLDMDDDPDTIEKECLEIFNSYSNSSENQTSKNSQEITVPNAVYESSVQGKKRTAHSTAVMSDHSALRHKTVKKTNNIKSAQELMFERYKIAEKAREAQQQVPQATPSPLVGLARPSIRIAAVSNIQQMLLAKKAIQEKINQGLKVNERTTIAHTVAPGGSRVAHVPKARDLTEKPIITEGSKQVPRIKRQTYLEKLLIETNQIYPTKGESSEEALRLEREIFSSHSGSAAAYHAAFISLLMKTRRRVASVKGETSDSTSTRAKVSHSDVLSGGKKNFSVIRTKKVDISMLSDKQIYEELLRFKLTPEELQKNGFPMSSDRPGYAVCSLNYELKYNEKYLYIKKITGNRRYCIRCSKLYDVDPKTLKQYKEGPETCSYHPGRKKSGGRNCERIYNCCNTSSTEGCATHIRHVTDSNDYENYPNCVRTLDKDDDNPGVYALDCEMVYSRLGTELARVTVVNLKKEIVYDTLVKPKYPVDCYNTFYSGIEEKMLEGVETTLKDVQAVLLSMFSNKTILIGHSLDSDLRALHLIHDTVVDTSVVFKNEKYFPSKYSLKELCARKISKIIQDNVNGHDSSEDAIAALEIMLHHVKEEVAKYDSLESYEADRGR